MKIDLTDTAKKQLKKFDNSVKKQIVDFLAEIEKLENPRVRGKALVGNLRGLWRYRVGAYRIFCEIRDRELIILVVEIGHRRKIYD